MWRGPSGFRGTLAKKGGTWKKRGYGERYNRFTHQKELDLVGATVELLAKQAKASDKAFDAMEMEEFKLAQQVHPRSCFSEPLGSAEGISPQVLAIAGPQD